MQVRIPSPLLSYTAQRAQVQARGGATLDAVLRDLDAQFPGIRFRVVDEQDRMRPHMIFFVNRQKVFTLDHPVHEHDEVMLMHALSGGEARGARTRFVALLRGVNVGRANRIAMADFRRLLEAHGASDVRTLLNSGNAVFDAALAGAAARSAFATTVRDALATELDVRSHVVLLPGADVRRLLAECSFTAEAAHDASRLLVALPYVRGALARLQPLCARSWQDEALAVGRHAAYLWCPHGVIASVLAPAVSAALDDAVTMRNWATATKVAALL